MGYRVAAAVARPSSQHIQSHVRPLEAAVAPHYDEWTHLRMSIITGIFQLIGKLASKGPSYLVKGCFQAPGSHPSSQKTSGSKQASHRPGAVRMGRGSGKRYGVIYWELKLGFFALVGEVVAFDGGGLTFKPNSLLMFIRSKSNYSNRQAKPVLLR